ncbi:MAG: GntR family transcriptional regulator, partial [Sphingobacterium sp.]|nr:GntR family transcriptional regulator [Sphingobacterium sp.]
PGLRLGAAVLPQKLAESVVNLKYINDLNTSKLTQAALDIFIKSGMYEKHVKKVKKSYEVKLRKAKEIISTLSPKNLIWHIPDNGIFIWVKLPEYIDIISLKNNLKKCGILINSTEEYFLKEEWEERDSNYLRLCISSVPEEDISSITDIISEIRILMEAHGESDVT